MSPIIFRSLIISSILLGIASTAIDAIIPNLIPEALMRAYENVPTPDLLNNSFWIAFMGAFLLIATVSTVGMMFFKRWARMMSLYTTIFGYVTFPFFGITLESGWATTLSDLSATIWGAVLAIAYYSSLAERFVKKQPSSTGGAS